MFGEKVLFLSEKGDDMFWFSANVIYLTEE